MAQKQTYPIRCPECGGQQDEELIDSLDIAKEPGLKKQLLENRLNAVTCKSCGHSFRIDKNLLVQDSEAKWMLYLSPTPLEKAEDAEEEFRGVLADLRAAMPVDQELPEVELVLSRVELVERLFLRESDLNVRVIEYIKYMLYTQNLDQVMPEDKAILFNTGDSTPEHLCFIIQDVESRKLETMLQYQREAYDLMLEMLEQDGDNSLIGQLFPGPHFSARAYLMNDNI